MKKKVKHRRIDRATTDLGQTARDPSSFLPALGRLGEALLAGRARQEEPWDRAATFSDLALLGLSLTDCRELVSQDLIFARNQSSSHSRTGRKVAGSHREPSATGRGERVSSSSRRASRNRPSAIGPRTRFILTDAGLAYLMKHIFARAEPSPSGTAQGEGSAKPSPTGRGQGEGLPSVSPSPALPLSHSHAPLSHSPLLPHYDIDSRQLSVAGELVLRLRVQARNLAAVLAAIERSGWKSRVPKPLNGTLGGNDPHHLANVALSLNEHQHLIDFSTDDGAICWAWRSSTTAPVLTKGHATSGDRRRRRES